MPCVRHLDREDVRLDQPRYLTLPLSVYEGTWTHSPLLVAMHLQDRSCMCVGIFFEIACYVPQHLLSSTALMLSARRGQQGQGTTSIGRGLYMESLIAGSTAAVRKCLLITRKIMIPPPNSGDPPDGPPYFTKKRFPLTVGTHQLHLRTQGSAFEKNDSPP